MLHRNVVPGIHRIEQAYTNFYIVEDHGRLTIVDTGLPAGWPLLLQALRSLGFERKDVAAIIITHAHYDHLGFAYRAKTELDVPLWIHQNESYIARHPYRYDHEYNRVLYPLLHPGSLPRIFKMAQAGALAVPGVKDMQTFDTDAVLDVPGKPQPVFVPGHTYGHTAYYFAGKNALLSGDALVTLDIYTGETGPQIIVGAATADTTEARLSLDNLLTVDNDAVILPGHGEPWTGGIKEAVTLAQRKAA